MKVLKYLNQFFKTQDHIKFDTNNEVRIEAAFFDDSFATPKDIEVENTRTSFMLVNASLKVMQSMYGLHTINLENSKNISILRDKKYYLKQIEILIEEAHRLGSNPFSMHEMSLRIGKIAFALCLKVCDLNCSTELNLFCRSIGIIACSFAFKFMDNQAKPYFELGTALEQKGTDVKKKCRMCNIN